MKTFILHWLDGSTEEVIGTDIANAFARAGYGGGAINALDHWEEKRMREEQVLMVDYDGLRGELVSLKTKYEPTQKAPYFRTVYELIINGEFGTTHISGARPEQVHFL